MYDYPERLKSIFISLQLSAWKKFNNVNFSLFKANSTCNFPFEFQFLQILEHFLEFTRHKAGENLFSTQQQKDWQTKSWANFEEKCSSIWVFLIFFYSFFFSLFPDQWYLKTCWKLMGVLNSLQQKRLKYIRTKVIKN